MRHSQESKPATPLVLLYKHGLQRHNHLLAQNVVENNCWRVNYLPISQDSRGVRMGQGMGTVFGSFEEENHLKCHSLTKYTLYRTFTSAISCIALTLVRGCSCNLVTRHHGISQGCRNLTSYQSSEDHHINHRIH